jgi:carboxymethylenebutenolidase
LSDHDLEALWDAHCRHEFETRDLDATMASNTRMAGWGRRDA